MTPSTYFRRSLMVAIVAASIFGTDMGLNFSQIGLSGLQVNAVATNPWGTTLYAAVHGVGILRAQMLLDCRQEEDPAKSQVNNE